MAGDQTYHQAFPSAGTMGEIVHPGMTLRDWFAGMALVSFQGDLHISAGEPSIHAEAARRSYSLADAMLTAREVAP